MNKLFTVARFPNGSWSTGGPVSSSEYAESELYRIDASSQEAAKKKAQGIRSRLARQGRDMPSQANPYYARARAAT